jgi:hypothetical protein
MDCKTGGTQIDWNMSIQVHADTAIPLRQDFRPAVKTVRSFTPVQMASTGECQTNVELLSLPDPPNTTSSRPN